MDLWTGVRPQNQLIAAMNRANLCLSTYVNLYTMLEYICQLSTNLPFYLQNAFVLPHVPSMLPVQMSCDA